MAITRIGRYEVERELGAGAMAVVYKAVDPLIGRTVAIKTIKFDSSFGTDQEELRQRLYREAQSAGNLNHPNIVTIYDIGEEGSAAFIAMEFIEGESLQEWMVRNPIPPVQQTLDIIGQIAAGLDYAAARGIIHRDIKPGNVLLTRDGRAKIADFGIAKFSTAKLTQTGAIIGTPAYMSPEQAMGKDLDGRSDLFSLGVIFYEMLTGEKPFAGSNPTTIMYKILHEEPVPPQRLNVTLHPAFDAIIGRMLAKDPDSRYQTCGELIRDLQNYTSLGGRPEAAPEPAPPKSGGRKLLITSLAMLALLAVGIAGYNFYVRSRRSPILPPPNVDTGPPAAKSTRAPAAPSPPPEVQPKEVQPKPEAAKIEAAAQPPADKAAPGGLAAGAGVGKDVPPAKKAEKAPPKPAAVQEKPARAEVKFEFAGEPYPVILYDGANRLQDLSAASTPVQVSAGEHHFRLVNDEVFLNQQVPVTHLKADQAVSVTIPALCSAYIEVPNDAYDGCEILVDARKLSSPYPAQIPRLAAGDHLIAFRWILGKYAGKEFSSTFAGQAGRLYRIRGEPQTEQISVQQIR